MAVKPKHISRKMLSSDERVVIETRPSAWLYMKAAFFSALVALIALVLLVWPWIDGAPEIPYLSDWYADVDYGDYVQMAFGAVFLIAVIFFFYKWIKWSSTIYAATDERIITQRGILNKRVEDIPLSMITNVDLAQSLGKRALGYGTIHFSTKGLTAGRPPDIVWDGVPDPYAVRRKLQEVMDVRQKPST